VAIALESEDLLKGRKWLQCRALLSARMIASASAMQTRMYNMEKGLERIERFCKSLSRESR